MTDEALGRRPLCALCLRPSPTCICAWVTPLEHDVDVLILQHPREQGRAKGTARLLQLSLSHCRLAVGEAFEPDELQALLDGAVSAGPPHQSRQALLLYPDTPQDAALGLLSPPEFAPGLLADPQKIRLVLLDGTWRESRKMLYRNPLLQRLPRLALRDLPASKYLIRKAQGSDQRSTLEATCSALAQLESDGEKYRPLLAAFDGFVAQQLGYQRRGARCVSGCGLPA